ncbi:MAG: leucine-rich repeat domain-containing protein [Bacteroidales bacterium]|nr:leucine-rich repeat domain-containing protein [Bacteroidales bacterium]
MRKQFFTLIFAAFCGMSSAFAYDFSAVCPTGQTLYYNITDAVNHEVEMTYPGESSAYSWSGYTEPIGEIELPSTVVFDGILYSLTSIGEYAFWDCKQLIGDLIIPDGVISIGESAFYDCGFTGYLVIGNSVTTIDKGAFYMCFCLTGDLIIPNSVISIGEDAFYSCSSFSGELIIPNSVTQIGSCAFTGCSGLSSLVLGENITTIEDGTFIGCDGLTNIKVNQDVPPTCGEAVFSGIDTTIPVYVPCGSKQAYQAAEGWGQFTNFRQMPYYEFTVEVAEPMTGTVDILQEPDCETEGIVLAVAENGFEFQNWETVEGVFVFDENPYTFTLTEDLHLVARFYNNVGVDDHEMATVSVYPNPTTGLFVVEGEDIEKVEVYNAMGQLVLTKAVSDDRTEIDLSNAANGMYLLRVTGKEGVGERNVVKR